LDVFDQLEGPAWAIFGKDSNPATTIEDAAAIFAANRPILLHVFA
jgi:hypothetical protein